jgi:invasion protein IalB
MRTIRATAALCAALSLTCKAALAGAMSANNFMLPSKDVALKCTPLNYSIHCSISLRANPEYSSYCFYIAAGRSYPMKTDYRFGFYNNIVSLHLANGSRVTADLKDLRTGAHARCFESG